MGEHRTALSLAVMGLLQEKPMHPYYIAQAMRERRIEDSIKSSYASIYHAIQMLQRDGLVEAVETTRDGRRPERTVYRLTETGEQAFQRSLRVLIGQPIRSCCHFAAGLFFLSSLTPEEAARLLWERAEAVDRELTDRRSSLTSLREQGADRLSLIESERAIAIGEAEIAWLLWLASEVESGSISWPASAPTDEPALASSA